MSKLHPWRPATAVPLAVLLALAAVPFIAQAIGQPFWTSFFARILIYAIAASALNLALGYGGLVSFGHALFMGLGSYAVALPAFHGVDSGWVHLAWCVGACALVALAVGAISLRTSGMSFIMITLAFAQMGYFLFVSLKQYGGDDGLAVSATSRFAGLDLGSTTTLYGAALAVLVLLTWWMARLRVAPFGMALRGARQNARRVQAIGLQPRRVQLAAFVISGVVCGLAGLLLANLNAYASPSTMSWTVSGELIVMVVLGGMGTVFGPLLGALVFLGLEEVLKGWTDHWMAIFGPLIVVMALVGRRGIVGLLEKLAPAARREPRAAAPEAALQQGGA
ncbi:branched-chain amino acid ABC transporter permease [Caldimonas sp. KR1-144]|uniref:branched-chain amino acid ABC transporter permease n=1 Tax=Caldimonas sp. KR1-144 TaxID=3400911 RepID=UPI003C086065